MIDNDALNGLDPDFREWFKENQEIWAEFCKIADETRAVKATWSARAAIDVIRWQRDIAGKDGEYKISNNRTPHLGRLYNRINGVTFFKEKKLTSKFKNKDIE